MKKLALFCYRKRRFVVIGWIALLVGLFALSSAIGGEYKTEFKLPGSESQAALDLLQARGVSERTGFPGQIVFKADQDVNDPAVRQAVESFFSSIQSKVQNVSIVSPYAPASSYQVAKDGKVAYAEINFSDRKQEQYLVDAKEIRKLRDAISLPGLQVELGGDIFVNVAEFSSEIIGVVAAVIILLIAFGSLLAMGLPIVTALFGIGCGVAIITGFVTNVLAVPDFTTSIAAMIGIGVGVDYALFVVTRYRQSLHDRREPMDAAMLTLDTAGRSVVFAGITVVIALLGMFMINLDFVRSISIGAVSAVLMTMLASITLLPALLGFVGKNIDRFGLPHKASAEVDSTKSFWYRCSRVIQGHPWLAFFASAAILVVLAIPVFSLRLGFSDAGNRVESDTTRNAYDILSTSFGQGFNGPIFVIAETNGDQDMAALGRLKSALVSSPGVASATDPQTIGPGVALFNVFPTTSPQDEATANLVHLMREQIIPASIAGPSPVVRLTGVAPSVVDFSDYMSERLPIFFGAVLVLSFLLLLVIFHSVVVPLKAVIMNMMSIGASFGAIVAIFQWGYLANVIGLGKEGPVEAWAPMMLFAIIFGLSMDYEVFLLTRVREEYDRNGGDNTRAVADGLATTGRVISAAAAIMVCVFGAFLLSPDRTFKLMGFGLAFAILIDATIVRLILVPSTMELLGKANWWAPKWLVKLLPVVHVRTAEQRSAQVAAVGALRSRKS